MSRARRWFYAIVAAQGCFLAVWAGWNESLLRRSPTVLLDTRPVDPMEIIRGDYLTMNYVIAQPPPALLPRDDNGGEAGFDYGDPVCATLAPEGEFHALASLRPGRCPCAAGAGGGPPELNGTIVWGLGPGTNPSIDYGIGRYYVPEGKGTPQGKVTARVSITPWCRALIREVYLDGVPYP